VEDLQDDLFFQNDLLKKQLDIALSDKTISEEDYNRSITELSYSFAISGYVEACLSMLFNIKGDYFKKEAIGHFKADSLFFNKCSLILELLSYSGLVDYDIMCNQPKGNA
jgi:hypothetical protein